MQFLFSITLSLIFCKNSVRHLSYLRVRHEYVIKQLKMLYKKVQIRKEPEGKQNQQGIPGETKLHERAICIAVFCLSPVSIQKCIPAFLSVSIVSGTPSWMYMCIYIQVKSQITKLIETRWIIVLKGTSSHNCKNCVSTASKPYQDKRRKRKQCHL